MFKKLLFIAVATSAALFLQSTDGAIGATINVSTPVTAATLVAAIESAAPGDTVIIPDGVHTNMGTVTLDSGGGSAGGGYVTITPATPGGVTFTGTLWVNITAAVNYLKFESLKFDDIRPITPAVTIKGLDFYGDFIWITNCTFANTGRAGDAKVGAAIRIESGANDAVVSYCLFDGWFNVEVIGPRLVYRTHIHHNIFRNSPANDQSSAIHLGGDSLAAYDLLSIVEYNVFDNCQGDVETISNKSSSNTYRYNVFRDSFAVVLRRGDDCVFDNNWSFTSRGPGIRVSGAGHTISNNYFKNSSTSSGTIYLRSGNVASGYATVDNCVFSGNRILHTQSNAFAYIFGYPVSDITPEDCQFLSNQVQMGAGTAVVRNYESLRFTWSGNQHYIASGSYWDTSGSEPTGITHVNPLIADLDADAIISTIGAGPDYIVPNITNMSPSGGVNCVSSPAPITWAWSTDGNCICRISTSDVSYSQMPSGSVETTGGQNHSDSEALACGAEYTRYVRCVDAYGNESATAVLGIILGSGDPPSPLPAASGSLSGAGFGGGGF